LAASDWQLGDLLKLAAKLGRSQTPTAELGQSSMRSVPGYLCQVFGCPNAFFRLYKNVRPPPPTGQNPVTASNRKIEDWAKAITGQSLALEAIRRLVQLALAGKGKERR